MVPPILAFCKEAIRMRHSEYNVFINEYLY